MADSRYSDASATPYEAVGWRDGALWVLDQTLLPTTLEYRRIDGLDDACEAIRSLRVRGAPAIGIAAAYALAAVAQRDRSTSARGVRAAVAEAAERLAATRPTAVNLRWAVARVAGAIAGCDGAAPARAAALDEARRIHDEQRVADRAMADAGSSLLPSGATVLTHCNTGPLATGGLGTALGVVIEAHRRGRIADVLVDETRPRLQGARLTSWELIQHGVPHHVIADSAAAPLIAAGRVDTALVGADRIAANGDTANKVGTYALAIACRRHQTPFYVVAPLSTVDLATADGDDIPVEESDEAEVLTLGGAPIAPPGARAFNPAFDVTPAELISAIVTEAGVLRPPYAAALRDAASTASGTL